MAGSFEKTNLSWQFQQRQQQAWQWIELQLSQLFSNLPEFGGPSSSSPLDWRGLEIVLRSLSWFILALLLVWLTWQLRRFSPAFQRLWPKLFSSSAQTLTRSSNSPVSVATWLQQAQNYHKRGNNRLACRALYLAMLQKLDDAAIIPQQLSRTDGEYGQLLENLPAYQRYQTLLTLHEQLWFGELSATAEDFQQCFKLFQELDNP